MFISTQEKKHLLDQVKIISELLKDFSLASSEITMLKARIKVLEANQVYAKKPKKPMTAAQKAKQREYQKAYNERQKAKKLAQGEPNVGS